VEASELRAQLMRRLADVERRRELAARTAAEAYEEAARSLEGVVEPRPTRTELAADIKNYGDAAHKPKPGLQTPVSEAPKAKRTAFPEKQFRDWAVAQGPNVWSVKDAAAALDRHYTTIAPHVKWALQRGIIREVKSVSRGRGRPTKLYTYVDPKTLSGPTSRPKERLPGLPAGTSDAAPTGRRHKVKPEVRALVRAAERDPKFDVTYSPGSGHYRIRRKSDNASTSIASTPSDHRTVLNDRAALRKLGLKI